MKIKVMTFNIRYDNPEDGQNRFENRKPLIKAFLDREKPDVIGFQEALPDMRVWLSEILCEYVLVGTGCCKDMIDGESSSIAYRRDKYDLVKFEQFWLSDTPDIPGSVYNLDQSHCPRMCAVATLVERQSGKVFNFANTHLDHLGRYAMVCGSSMIVSRLLSGKEHLPFFVTGDMNLKPGDAELQVFKNAPDFNDLTSGVGDDETTYHGFGKVQKNCKIDYIFSSGSAVDGTLVVHKDREDGLYLSDHYPISVVAEI